MAAYSLSAKAVADLDGIYEYTILEFGLEQARAYLLGLHERFEMLAEQPGLGRDAKELAPAHRFRFRTPTLLNPAATGPYTHSGIYGLEDTLGHYFMPDLVFDAFVERGGVCSLAQFADHPECATLFPNLEQNSSAALARALADRIGDPDAAFPNNDQSPPSDGPPLLAFLEALNDPCTQDRQCLAPWIPEPSEAPDENQLNAVDEGGEPL